MEQSEQVLISPDAAVSPWRLHLFGMFRLLDPYGQSISLPTRKVEGLLAILALNRECGIERDEIGEALWPGRPLENQRTSLRQALAQLRKALGENAIVGARSVCSLSPEFEIACDYDEPNMRTSSAFMPGQSSEWFEDLRQERFVEPRSVVRQFLKTLEWCADNDPNSMFSMLRASLSLSKGLPCTDMMRLLGVAGISPKWLGWSAYWRGASEEDLLECAKYLRLAIREAKQSEDWELASIACLELGKVYSRTGRCQHAERVCQIAEAVAARAKTPTTKGNALRLKGTFLLHWSDGLSGLDSLHRAEDFLEDKLEHAIAQNTRAFYEASLGLFNDAYRTQQEPLRLCKETGHVAMEIVSSMTRAMLSAQGGSRLAAITEFEALSHRCRLDQVTQFSVYSDEVLARLFHLGGDRGLAKQRIDAARIGRKSCQMVMTPLESRRMTLVS